MEQHAPDRTLSVLTRLAWANLALLLTDFILVVMVGWVQGRKAAEPAVVTPDVVGGYCVFFDAACPPTDKDVDYVLGAMRELASLDGPEAFNIIETKWRVDTKTLSRLIVLEAKRKRLDPLLLTTMAWIETRFNPKAVSDFVNRPQEGKNCGLLQVRTDLPNRPTCEKMQRPEDNLAWATDHLRDLAALCNGEICLVKYNAGDYETRVWRKLDWLRRQMWLKELR